MKTEDKQFITWFFNRLVHKYDESADIVQKLGNFISTNIIMPKNIDVKTIDKICKKFYPDFDIERVPGLNIGWNDKERNNTRSLIIETIKELAK